MGNIGKRKRLITRLIFMLMPLVIGLIFVYRNGRLNNDKKSPSSATESDLTSLVPTPSPSPIPKYGVTVSSTSEIYGDTPHNVKYTMTLTNYSVEPYITNFSFNECVLVDRQGKEYLGSIPYSEKEFNKAILPGESVTLSLVSDVEAQAFNDCSRGSDGQKVCTTISDVHIKSCKAYVTNDGGQASNGYGKDLLIVDFPIPSK